MSRRETHRKILDCDLLWFGGLVGAPKHFDSGTSHYVFPKLRDSGQSRAAQKSPGGAEGYVVVLRQSGDDWTVDVEAPQ